MKKNFFKAVLAVISLLYFSCSLDETPVDEFFEKNANGVMVATHVFSQNYPIGNNGFECIPSDSDCLVTLKLTNPQSQEVDLSFTIDAYSLDNNTFTRFDNEAEGISLLQKSSNRNELELKFPQIFLENLEKSDLKRLDVNISVLDKKNPEHVFSKYNFQLNVNSIPPAVESACVMLDADNKLVLCFEMPIFKDSIHENDTNTLKITLGGTTYSYTFDSTAETAAAYNLDSGLLTSSRPTVLNKLDEFSAEMSVSSTRAFYFLSGISNSNGLTKFEVKIEDTLGLSSNIAVTNAIKKLKPPVLNIATGSVLNQTTNDGTCTVLANIEKETIYGDTVVGTGKINYEVKSADADGNPIEVIYSTEYNGDSVGIELHPGTNVIELIAKCDGYVDSDSITYTYTVNKKILYVDATSATSTPVGSKAYPMTDFKTALDSLTNVSDAENCIYILSDVSLNNSIILPNGSIKGIDVDKNPASRAIEISGGSALTVNKADTVLSNLQVKDNSVARSVSGINVLSSAKLTMIECSVENFKNTTTSGTENIAGGMDVKGVVDLQNVEFRNCQGYYGGAIHLKNEYDIILKRCSFNNCTATNGGAMAINTSKQVSIKAGNINDCSAGKGGAFFIDSGNLRLEGYQEYTGGSLVTHPIGINRCTASDSGGAIYLNNGVDVYAESLMITDCGVKTGYTGKGGVIASRIGGSTITFIGAYDGQPVINCSSAEISNSNIILGTGDDLVVAGDVTFGVNTTANKAKVIFAEPSAIITVWGVLNKPFVAELELGYDVDGNGTISDLDWLAREDPLFRGTQDNTLTDNHLSRFVAQVLADDLVAGIFSDYGFKIINNKAYIRKQPYVSLGNISNVTFELENPSPIKTFNNGKITNADKLVVKAKPVDVYGNAADITGAEISFVSKLMDGDYVLRNVTENSNLEIWLNLENIAIGGGVYTVFSQIAINGVIYSNSQTITLSAIEVKTINYDWTIPTLSASAFIDNKVVGSVQIAFNTSSVIGEDDSVISINGRNHKLNMSLLKKDGTVVKSAPTVSDFNTTKIYLDLEGVESGIYDVKVYYEIDGVVHEFINEDVNIAP